MRGTAVIILVAWLSHISFILWILFCLRLGSVWSCAVLP